MQFEDKEFVGLRVSLLLLIVIFGLPGNIATLRLKARSFKTQSSNGIACCHLAFVDLLICMFHAPIGIGLELSGYFSLKNDIGYNLRNVCFFLNKEVSNKIFAFTSLTSQVTLMAIALFRCWTIFNPFRRFKKSLMVTMLLVPDGLTAGFVVFLQKAPAMYFDSSANVSDTNNSGNQSQRTWITDGNTTDFSTGKTETEDHGKVISLLFYTVLSTSMVAAICYSLIGIEIFRAHRRLYTNENSTSNQAYRKFLSRQAAHIKTQLILLLTLFVTSLPSLLMAAVGYIPSYAVLRVRGTLVALGSAINPYMYCLMTAENRRAAVQFLKGNKD